MTEYITAWQCIGCGRLEVAQPCVGVCQDRRVTLVAAPDHDVALERARVGALALALLGRLIATRPAAGRVEESWRAFQQAARPVLGEAADLEAVIAESGDGT